jgi:N-acetylglucosamine kinase-like BadF-type ATPase
MPQRDDLLLGVDGGNTKTIALVARDDGIVVGVGTAGCADMHNAASPGHALDEIVRAASTALEAAGARAGDLNAAAFSLAGADWPEDFEFLRGGLAEQLELVVEPLVVNDAIGAIRSGTDDGVGVAAVCGSGGAIGARNSRGEIFHLGFWPDGTGAFALGSEGLAAVWRAGIGVGPDTSLTARALARWECADSISLLHAFTRIGGLGDSRTARGLFADAVLDEAAAGDQVAHDIVELAGRHLGDYARVCAAQTGQVGSPFPLVLAGGVLRHTSTLLRESILGRVPDAVPVYPVVEPVAGAVLLAADEVGARPDLERLGATAPTILASSEPRGEG